MGNALGEEIKDPTSAKYMQHPRVLLLIKKKQQCDKNMPIARRCVRQSVLLHSSKVTVGINYLPNFTTSERQLSILAISPNTHTNCKAAPTTKS